MKLRLLLFDDCDRSCKGCCNKQFNLSSLPVETNFTGYEKIFLTGGEPMLKPEFVEDIIKKIRKKTDAKIILYTAKVDDVNAVIKILGMIDGMTVTLHKPNDIVHFCRLNTYVKYSHPHKSFRLNVFKDVKINPNDFPLWKCKTDIEWIKNCPLPKNEVFKRLQKNNSKEM